MIDSSDLINSLKTKSDINQIYSEVSDYLNDFMVNRFTFSGVYVGTSGSNPDPANGSYSFKLTGSLTLTPQFDFNTFIQLLNTSIKTLTLVSSTNSILTLSPPYPISIFNLVISQSELTNFTSAKDNWDYLLGKIKDTVTSLAFPSLPAVSPTGAGTFTVSSINFT